MPQPVGLAVGVGPADRAGMAGLSTVLLVAGILVIVSAIAALPRVRAEDLDSQTGPA
jgi:hypothetical protein